MQENDHTTDVEDTSTEELENSSTEEPGKDKDGVISEPWLDPAAAEKTIKDLRKENASVREKYKNLKPFEEEAARLKEESKSELQRMQERAESVESEKSSLSAENARLRVALEKGVPLSVVESLGGSTTDEITERLEALIAWKEEGKPTKPSKPVSELRNASTGDADAPLDLSDPAKMRKYLEQNS